MRLLIKLLLMKPFTVEYLLLLPLYSYAVLYFRLHN
jgi:hypothetical protein